MNAIARTVGVTIGEIINVGRELKAELEIAARKENGDATWLARRILHEWLAARAAEPE
jgi:hypothetical protein